MVDCFKRYPDVVSLFALRTLTDHSQVWGGEVYKALAKRLEMLTLCCCFGAATLCFLHDAYQELFLGFLLSKGKGVGSQRKVCFSAAEDTGTMGPVVFMPTFCGKTVTKTFFFLRKKLPTHE